MSQNLSVHHEQANMDYVNRTIDELEHHFALWELEQHDILKGTHAYKASERILEHIGFEIHLNKFDTHMGFVSRFPKILSSIVDKEPARV